MFLEPDRFHSAISWIQTQARSNPRCDFWHIHCACSKEINAKYETYVLNVGDFDERIFLGEDSTMEIGTPAKGSLASAYESSERIQITRNLLQNYHDV